MEEIKLNLENLSENEREQLMALVKKANEPKSKVWKPADCELYYYISTDGTTVSYTHYNNSIWDKGRYALGNCFRTREEAEETLIHQQMLARWKRLSIEAGEEENDWKGTSGHWCVYYSCEYNRLAYDVFCYRHDANIFFPTKETCIAAVQELGEENVKKYILNFKE